MTYRMPPDIETKIDSLISSGEFVNRADAISTLLRFGLDYRVFDVPTAVREYLQSDEGIELVRTAARKRVPKK